VSEPLPPKAELIVRADRVSEELRLPVPERPEPMVRSPRVRAEESAPEPLRGEAIVRGARASPDDSVPVPDRAEVNLRPSLEARVPLPDRAEAMLRAGRDRLLPRVPEPVNEDAMLLPAVPPTITWDTYVVPVLRWAVKEWASLVVGARYTVPMNRVSVDMLVVVSVQPVEGVVAVTELAAESVKLNPSTSCPGPAVCVGVVFAPVPNVDTPTAVGVTPDTMNAASAWGTPLE
jgi:hypothetical protein